MIAYQNHLLHGNTFQRDMDMTILCCFPLFVEVHKHFKSINYHFHKQLIVFFFYKFLEIVQNNNAEVHLIHRWVSEGKYQMNDH